ncbi:MAG TPA: hydrogenase small subunit [Candidatus Sulfotelmatobacter sp.]|nr:hydrogenase small subunit [Candidatus Sulfotelmatobacter sp.]
MKQISRRSFFKFCTVTAAGLGLDPFDIGGLSKALANPTAPTVLWLQGSACSGCTMSFLDYISATAPTDAADVLINYINLAYHPELAAVAGESAAAIIQQVEQSGNFILVLEGGVPTNFNGGACYAWSAGGVDQTFQQAVKDLAARARTILCMGTCASFGGIPAAPPNPAGVVSVKTLTGRSTINIAGCPPHPAWMVWAIVQLLQGKTIPLDSSGRPTAIYGTSVHNQCPNRGTTKATTYGVLHHCLLNLGCRGPQTGANCPIQKWNNGVNWCVGAGSPCLGCTSSSFPGTSSFNQ